MTNGPLASATGTTLGAYGYDSRNRLTSHGGSSYVYNPDSLRTAITGTGAATFVVDPNAALSRTLMRTKSGTTTYYVYGYNLLYEETAGAIKTYHCDHLGNTLALASGGTTISDRWSYAPFGAVTSRTGTTDTPFQFNGALGVQTDANGMYYMRARYYNPRIMRFLNADPIGFAGGMNWHASFGNNPISNADPSGTIVETVWDVANVGLGAYSLQANVRQGNWGWAALDAVGLIYDGVATAVPFLPAGASAGFKASRAGASIVHSAQVGLDVARVADKTHDAARAMDVAQVTRQEASRIGTELHSSLDNFANTSLSDALVSGFAGRNRSAGMPDMTWTTVNGLWADVTTNTAGSWARHARQYGTDYGEGFAILYGRGEGVTNLSRLFTGAGTSLTGLQLTLGSSSIGRK